MTKGANGVQRKERSEGSGQSKRPESGWRATTERKAQAKVENIRVCNRAAHAGERRQGSPKPVPEVEEGHPDARVSCAAGALVLKRVEELNIYVEPACAGSEWRQAEQSAARKRDRVSERIQAGGRPPSGRRWPGAGWHIHPR